MSAGGAAKFNKVKTIARGVEYFIKCHVHFDKYDVDEAEKRALRDVNIIKQMRTEAIIL